MTNRVNKKELIQRISLRTGSDKTTVEMYLDAALEEIYEAIKAGESVTLTGFGSFTFGQVTPGHLSSTRVKS